MKNFKKILSLAIAVCLVIGAVPMFTTSAETEPAFSYTQNFDSLGSVSDLSADFHTRFSKTTSVSNCTTFIETDDLKNYMVISNGRLARIKNNTVENAYGENGKDATRPQWGQMYMFYKHRTFSEFEVSVDLVNINPSAFNMLHFGTNMAGDPYRQGFTVCVRPDKDNAKTKMAVFLGSNTEVKSVLGTNWYIPVNNTSSVTADAVYSEGVNLKVAFKDGIATVYINGTAAITRTFAADEYYIALAGAHAGTYDNFTITSNDVADDWCRTEFGGYYENDFDANGDHYGILEDFYLGYTPTNSKGSAAKALDVDEAVKYFTFINGTYERSTTDVLNKETGADGARPWFQQVYMYYKNQTFKEFEMEVDMKCGSRMDSFQMIHFGGSLTGNIYSQGFSVVASYNTDNKSQLEFFLGTAAEAGIDLSAHYIKNTSTASFGYIDYPQDTIHLKITFKDGTANLYVNNSETPVATKSGLLKTNYYVALCEGWRTGSFDNLKITATTPALERTEADGVYSNNFNNLMKNELAEDFGFFYDKYTSNDDKTDTSNDMIAVKEGTAEYGNLFKVDSNITRTFASGIDKDSTQNGNKPARSMMYYTYKNQKFTNFTLEVDAYYPGNSTCYDLITVGDYGQGIYNNNGYVVGFRHTDVAKTDVFVGTSEQAKANYCSWGPNTAYYYYTSYTNRAGDKNLSIKIVVEDGMLSLYINDEAIFADEFAVPVGVVDGYISLANGIDKNATYDNLSIVGDAKLSYNAVVGQNVAINAATVAVDEIGYEIDFGNEWSTSCVEEISSAVAGALNFFVTAENEIVYADANGDGSADADDIVAVRASLLNVADGLDIDADGELNIVDLVKIKKAAATAVETITASEGEYTYLIDFSGIIDGYTGEATVTPYYVLNGATIYGEAVTVNVVDGIFA